MGALFCDWGDFNDIANPEEKWGGRARTWASCWPMCRFIAANELYDLGFIGHGWTWQRMRENGDKIQERLDRYLSSQLWATEYWEAKVFHIEVESSDHCPLLLDTNPRSNRKKQFFQFDSRWIRKEGFKQAVQDSWAQQYEGTWQYQICQKIKQVRMKLNIWKRSSCPNAANQIKDLKLKIQQAYDSEHFWKDLQDISPVITPHTNLLLIADVTEKELREAIWHMEPNSAPGPDGMSAAFYKSCFDIVKYDIINAVNDFIVNGRMLKEINQTCIVLLPKVKGAVEVKQFRPISLCNVIYKIISKILANRLKKFLPSCISENQNGFVSNRHIMDSYIIGHEVIHHMANKRKGKLGHFALKLDIAKAFDKMEWSFICFVMAKLGFCDHFIKLIYECLSTATFSFIINGDRLGFVKPSRGIRQGDPLSPYLFILGAQGLSHLLHKKMINNIIPGIQIARHGPRVNHLFFADDALLISNASVTVASSMKQVLDSYAHFSGQQINIDKSAIFFSKNVNHADKEGILGTFSGISEAFHSKYLGLPIIIGRSKSQMFKYVVDKIKSKICSWKVKTLSHAGKAIMLTSSLSTIANYLMSCIKLPNNIIREIHSTLSNFWWGNIDKNTKGYHWVNWREVCKPKKWGGLGFKDLGIMNSALLAKVFWRIITNPNLLVSKMLKSKYYPCCSPLEAKLKSNSSFVWRSLMSTQDFLRNNSIYVIGDGADIHPWKFPWIPDNVGYKPITPCPSEGACSRVADFILHKQWNIDKLKEYFWGVDIQSILKIPISLWGSHDQLCCAFSDSGKFKTADAYNKLLVQKLTNDHTSVASISCGFGSDKYWTSIWNLPLSGKYKFFLWRIIKRALPVGSILLHRFQFGDGICPICKQEEESIDHLFIQCPIAQMVWKQSGIFWDCMHGANGSLFLWWESMVNAPSSHQLIDRIVFSIYILWYIWKARCSLIFNQERMDFMVICLKAREAYCEHVQFSNESNDELPISSSFSNSADFAHQNVDKCIFFDAAWTSESKNGIGFCIMNNLGELEAEWAFHYGPLPSALAAEAAACRMALQTAMHFGWNTIMLFSDCKVLVEAINNHKDLPYTCMAIGEDIYKLMSSFVFCKLLFVNRGSNVIAHKLASFGASLISGSWWHRQNM